MMEKTEKDFAVKKGVLGVGLPVAFLMSLTMGFQVPGYIFKLQGFNIKIFLLSLAIFTPIFAVVGYFWGVIVYKLTRNRR